jgi:hypothetical protein
MKVQAVNNTNKYYKYDNINFKAEFLKTRDLEYVMSSSPIESLNEFNKILQKIKSVKDNVVFWVESHWSTVDINNGSSEKSIEEYWLYKQIGQDEKTKKWLDIPWRYKAYDSYGGENNKFKLAGINAYLKDMYKDVFASESEQRAEITNEIDKLLIKG